MTITYVGSSSSIADNGSQLCPAYAPPYDSISITPPSGMQAGDLVILFVANGASPATPHVLSGLDGQFWVSRQGHKLLGVGACAGYAYYYSCIFDGTWDANPSVLHQDNSSAHNMELVMHVFRTDKVFLNNVGISGYFDGERSYSQIDSSNQDVSIFGVNTYQSNAVVIGLWAAPAPTTWAVQTSGWSALGSNQYRNLAEGPACSDLMHSISFAYKIQSAGNSGAVVNRKTSSGVDDTLVGIFTWEEFETEEDPPSGDNDPVEFNYFASSATPDDEGMENTSYEKIVVPPADMQAGDLVIAACSLNTAAPSILYPGGQTWTRLENQGYGPVTIFWCQFNGTWSGNLQFNCPASHYLLIATIHVFRPTTPNCVISASDAASHYYSAFVAPSSPYDVTKIGIFSRKPKPLFFAAWTTADLNTWELQTAGWSNAGKAQYRYDPANSSTNRSLSCAYKKQDSAGFSGDVVNRQTANGGDTGHSFIGCFIAYLGTPTGNMVFHIDPENGDDADNGVDWDHSWRSIKNGAISGRVLPGDEIRVCKSPDPVLIGSGTWTKRPDTLITSINFSSSTNTTPIQINFSSDHPLQNGDYFQIAGYAGNTTANGIWKITKVDNRAITLDGSSGIAAGSSWTGYLVNSFGVGFANPIVKMICDCNRAWTAANGATVSFDTGNYQKTNYGAVKVVKSSSPLNNTKYAYFDLGESKDFSACDRISFWCSTSTSLTEVSTAWKICLCSDAAGDTVVDEFIVPPISSIYFNAVTIARTGGGALGSSIRSIAIYTGSAAVTYSFYINQIVGCFSGELNLQSLIGKTSSLSGETDNFYGLHSFSQDGCFVRIGSHNVGNSVYSYCAYQGDSETCDTYFADTLKVDISAWGTLQVSGSSGSIIDYSGGWNKATGLQDGISFLDGLYKMGNCVVCTSGSYFKISKINICRFSNAIYLRSMSNFELDVEYITACYSGLYFYSAVNNGVFKIKNIVDIVSYGLEYYSSGSDYSLLVFEYIDLMSMIQGTGIGVNHFFQCVFNHIKKISGVRYSGITGIYTKSVLFKRIDEISFCENGIRPNNGNGMVFRKVGLIKGCSDSGIYDVGIANEFYNITFQNNTKSIYVAGDRKVLFKNITSYDATKVSVNASYQYGYRAALIDWSDGTSGVYYGTGSIEMQSDVRHTESGYAWKFAPINASYTEMFPLSSSIAKILCAANKQVIVKAWMRRSNTGLTMNLVCPGGQVAGVDDDVVSSMTAEADTWEEVTISFTPTAAAVVEIVAQAYGGTTYSGYVDDLTITHEA